MVYDGRFVLGLVIREKDLIGEKYLKSIISLGLAVTEPEQTTRSSEITTVYIPESGYSVRVKNQVVKELSAMGDVDTMLFFAHPDSVNMAYACDSFAKDNPEVNIIYASDSGRYKIFFEERTNVDFREILDTDSICQYVVAKTKAAASARAQKLLKRC